jgi:hypothetical protein
MPTRFQNNAQELTYQKVEDYLNHSMFRRSMRVYPTIPRFDLLYKQSTLVEVEVLDWDVHPWEDSELAIVRASSRIAVIDQHPPSNPDLSAFLLAENRKMRFGAFHIDEAGHILFSHTVLGGENLDLMELQTCILSVAAIAATYTEILISQFGEQVVMPSLLADPSVADSLTTDPEELVAS